MATKDTAKTEQQPFAAAVETTTPPVSESKGSDMPLSTENPRGVKTDGKMSKEREAYNEAVADADELQRDVDMNAGKSPEQKKADESYRKADDLRAKAAEAEGQGGEQKGHTVADAGVLAVVDPKMKSGDHFAQKFGNDPENPKLAPGVQPDENLVRVSRVTPDVPGEVFTEVPKEMVGDYERAGWNRA